MADIEELLIDAQKRWDALPPDQKRAIREAQKKSWVVGEFMLSHPDATREYAEEVYEKVVLGIGL